MKKTMIVFLLASVGLAYTIKTLVELTDTFEIDMFDLSEDEVEDWEI
jgi:hypothetical protein